MISGIPFLRSLYYKYCAIYTPKTDSGPTALRHKLRRLLRSIPASGTSTASLAWLQQPRLPWVASDPRMPDYTRPPTQAL